MVKIGAQPIAAAMHQASTLSVMQLISNLFADHACLTPPSVLFKVSSEENYFLFQIRCAQG